MNILIPDTWLREFLITKARPEEIQKYLSLCGPSVERLTNVDDEIVYDIEVTTNRPDAMSVVGIAREAAAILPRFGIKAVLKNDPYREPSATLKTPKAAAKPLHITTDGHLNPRWTTIVLDHVRVGASPDWLRKRLEATGIRSLNTVIDITNYLMRAYGQPAHAFDYDQILPKKGVPTMVLRASRRGEVLTTLDGKTHTLPGDDIVIEDGSGRLIDLCGIMGAENSSIRATTRTVVLFLQTYDPVHIRRTMMALSHRTEAGSLFEKGTDPELVLPAIHKGIALMEDLTGASPAGPVHDLYPAPYHPARVTVTKEKTWNYIGTELADRETLGILSSLGLSPAVTEKAIAVSVPSFRRDIMIDVDIIEEIARLYGYQNIKNRLPDSEPPVVYPDPTLNWEQELKIRLRDWGYTELVTYSLISEKLMDIFHLDKKNAYKLANPLSEEWVYLRPHLTPSVLLALRQNLNFRSQLTVFELGMGYEYRPGDLPVEKPTLVVAWTGKQFRRAKGLADAIFRLFGIPFPEPLEMPAVSRAMYSPVYLNLGKFGSVGEINGQILADMGIHTPVTRLYLDISELVHRANPAKKYLPIPKYPPSFEDIALVVPPDIRIGPLISALKGVHPLVADVTLLDSYNDIRTLHITYQATDRSLTSEEIQPIRKHLLEVAKTSFHAVLKQV